MIKLSLKIMIDDFHAKGYGWLSNFYKCDIYYEGILYHSSECAYMSAKRDDLRWKVFCSTNEPEVVKEKSRRIRIKSDWDSLKIYVMFDVIRLKFKIPELRDKLLATNDEQLVEGNNWGDCFWGVSKKTGIGRNFLGRILMHVRDEIKQGV